MDYGSLWTDILRVDETTSTNDDVAAAARAGDPEGLVVVADHQTAGRGRLDRQWVSPRGTGLTFSVLLRPTVPEQRWTWLPLISGVALARAWSDTTGLDLRLKWPNDLLVDDRKVAGILAARHEGAVVIGVGLNVTASAADLPFGGATSLALCGTTTTDRDLLLAAGLEALASDYQDWSRTSGDPSAPHAAYSARCATLGTWVRADLPDGSTVEGPAGAIDLYGRLVVTSGDEEMALSSGDVIHVRSG